jgi:uncharacterized protein (DUF58 family)
MRAEQYLAPETLAQLAPFELRAKMVVEGAMNGMHSSPRQGAAVEFASHRQYTPGDGIRHLDWRVFARTDKLYVKEYRQETNLDIVVLVDGSGSMRFGTVGAKAGWGGTRAQDGASRWTKYDHATAVAAAVSFLALAQRDRVGVAVFSDGLHGGVRKSGAPDQWRAIVRCLASEPVEGAVQWTKVADQTIAQNHGHALYIIVSDFLSPPAEIRAGLARLAHRGNDAILLCTLDRSELEFSMDEQAPFEGLEGESSIDVDTRVARAAYLAALQAHLDEVRRVARDFGFDMAVFDTHESVGPVLSATLARREAFSRRRSVR